jgi:pyruvate formate lyase activating enzyme
MKVASAEKECAYWQAADDRVLCTLCPLNCRIAEGRAGACKVRVNHAGRLIATTYGRVSSAHLDPIEKKPLFHFYPGSVILSLGTLGCNLSCQFCQNWTISQEMSPTRALSAAQAVEMAAGEQGNIGIAFTYNEPVIWFEYVMETAALARERGLKNVMVTNGFANREPWVELLRYVDAVNVDVKSMRPEFYRRICRGKMEPVLENVRLAKEAGCWVEVTNLVVTNHNDAPEDFEKLTDWLDSIDPDIPLHFSRYHPDYKMTDPPTPLATLERAAEIARRKLRYVYVGNVLSRGGEDTVCPSCGAVVIGRSGFSITRAAVRDGKCAACGFGLALIGSR